MRIYICMCMSVYLSIYLSISLSLYIYIYTCVSMYLSLYIYVYIYIYAHITKGAYQDSGVITCLTQPLDRHFAGSWSRYRDIGRGDATVGNPHRAQIYKLELFELILLLKLNRQLPVEQFEATVSQSAVPLPPSQRPCEPAKTSRTSLSASF